MSEIIDKKIFLGDMVSANDEIMLKENNITCVICVAEGLNIRLNNPNIKFYKYDLQDNSDCDISLYFDEIGKLIESEKTVLVICAAGISRSSTIVISYIMNYYEFNLKDAFNYVRNKRNMICPNKNFLRCLFDYEIKLFGRNSINWDEIVQLCFYS
jgi:protein-tyrosine phosphatase